VREWPVPVVLPAHAALDSGDIVLAWRPGDTSLEQIVRQAAADDAAALLFANYDERIEGAYIADVLRDVRAPDMCSELHQDNVQLWNIQPHGGRELFYRIVASSLAGQGLGHVIEPLAGARPSNTDRRWLRLIQADLFNPLFVSPST
jgi:hypothetical protein